MCIIAMRSVTGAMRAKGLLRGISVYADVVSLDSNLTKNGCAYGLSLPCDRVNRAIRLLDSSGISYGEIIGGR